MTTIFVEKAGAMVDFPDGTPPDVMETAIRRKFFTPAEEAAQPSFRDREGYRFDKGRAMVDVGKTFSRALRGEIADDEAINFERDRTIRFTEENDQKFQANRISEKFVGASTELAPYLLDSTKEAIVYGELFAAATTTAALVGGQAGPQIALPEEVITVPAANMLGRSMGQAYGAWMNASNVEGGLIYGELIKNGVDRETAIPFAVGGGTLIGAIELLQVGQVFNRFLPAGVKYNRRLVSQFLVKALKGKPQGFGGRLLEISKSLLNQTAARTGLELAEEEAQEVVNLTAEAGAHLVQAINTDSGFQGPDFEEVKTRLTDTATQGLLAFPLLGLPGSAVTSIKTVNQRSAAIANLQASVDKNLTPEQRQKAIERVERAPVTEKGQHSLEFELADLVTQAADFDTLQDFTTRVELRIDPADVQGLGFDNFTSMMSSVFDASRAQRTQRAEEPVQQETVSEEKRPLEGVARDNLEGELQDLRSRPQGNLSDDELANLHEIESEIETRGDIDFDFGQNIEKNRQTPPETQEENQIREAELQVVAFQQAEEFRRSVGRIRKIPKGQILGNPFLEKRTKDISRAFFTSDPNAESLDEVAQRLDLTIDELLDQMVDYSRDRAESLERFRSAKTDLRNFAKKQRSRDRRRAISEKLKNKALSIDSIKKELIGYIEQNLILNDRGKFLRAVKNTRTRKGLQKHMTRVDQLAELQSQRFIKTRIKKELKDTQPTKRVGKPRGRFTPEIQELLDVSRKALRLKKADANKQLEESIAQVSDEIPSAIESVRRRVLSMVAGGTNTRELMRTLDIVQSMKATGRAAFEIKVAGRRQAIGEVIDRVIGVVSGGKGVAPGDLTFGKRDLDKERGKVRTALDSGIDSLIGWVDVLDKISLKDKSSTQGRSYINQFGDVFAETIAEKKGNRLANEQVRKMVEASYQVDTDNQVVEILADNTRPVLLGVFKSTAGVTREFIVTKDQAIKKWMELQDPTLKESITSEKGNAYSPKMLEALNKFLTEKDRTFGQAQLAFYQEYYQGVNEVYRELHHINLPNNKKYSPIQRDGIDSRQSQGFGELLQELQTRASVENGSMISRVRNVRPIKLTSSTAILQQHIAEMERFKNWGLKLRDLNSVFKDGQVKAAIVQHHGSKVYNLMLDFIEDFTRGGVNRAKKIDALDQFRTSFTRAKLAVRPVIGIKQLVSFVAFAETIPSADFAAGVNDFLTDPVGKTKILMESEFLRTRGENIDRDIKAAIRTDAFRAFRKKPNFLNSLMMNVQMGDKGGIILGGWAVYRHALKEGKTKEQALTTFSQVANRTQQSGDISEQSAFQRGGSVAKLFSMFASSQNQYLRREIAAVRNFKAGRIKPEQFAKTIAIYHFILPMLFQWVSDGFRWDPDEQKRAAILGSLNGAFIVGDALEYVLRQALGLRRFDIELPVVNLIDSVTDVTGPIFDAIRGDSVSNEDFIEAFKGIIDVGGVAMGGVPLKAGFEMVENVNELADGNVVKGFLGLLGWSDFSLEGSSDGRKF